MNYFDQINRAIDTIESQINEPLDMDALCRKAGMSRWHFQRIFRGMVGDTVREYHEQRRLSLAAWELIKTQKKIIDVALDYGFDSHEVFSRAFKRSFEKTPKEFRVEHHNLSFIPQKARVTLQYLEHLYKGISMQPRIKKIEEMVVFGLNLAIKSIHEDGFENNFQEIPQLWQNFRKFINESDAKLNGMKLSLINQMPGSEARPQLEYVAGAVVSSHDRLPDGLVRRVIPEGEYAEFIHRGPMRQVEHTMNYIYGSWLPKSGRIRGVGPEFSVRPDNFDPQSEDAEITILIPLAEAKKI